MKVGFLYEGHLDANPLQIIIKRIIQETNPEIQDIDFISKPAYGSIDGQIRIAAIFFYDTNDCDIAVFVADSDYKDDKQRRIRALVSSYCKKVKPSSSNAIGCPHPELEQWFFDEENAIKQIYPSLSANKQLPYLDMNPKERFQRIINENNNDITVTRSEIYAKVAGIMDLRKLYMCSKSFKSFYKSLKKAI